MHTRLGASEVPQITISEVKETFKEMKNNNAPNIGNLKTDTMIFEEDEAFKKLATDVNGILKKKYP